MQMQCTADDVKVDEQTVRSGNSNHTAVAIPEQPDRINLPMQYLFLIGLPRLSPLFVILRFPGIPTLSAPSRREEFVPGKSLQPPS